MRKIKPLLALFLGFSLLFGEELEVQVPIKTKIYPFFIESIQTKQCPFSPAYLSKLLEVLQEDFCYTGFTKPANTQSPQNLLVKPFLVGKQFYLEVFFPQEKKEIRSSLFHLTGFLPKDIETLHGLMAHFQKTLFSLEGIQDKKILFSYRAPSYPDAKEKTSEIWVTDLSGEISRQLTYEKNYCVCPKFLPKKPYHFFFYVSYKEGESKIMASSLHHTQGWKIIPLKGNQHLPSISAQLDKIAFISDAAGKPDLFLQPFDPSGKPTGKPKQLFSLPYATQASSSFSPKGNYLAFVSDKDGTPRIYIMKIPKEKERALPEVRLITKQNRYNSSPAWSKDGKKLAYSAKTNGIRQIWVYDFETKEEKQITESSLHLENPCWAPNDFHLICNSEDDKECELYLIHLNDPIPLKISRGMGEKRFPSWEP